ADELVRQGHRATVNADRVAAVEVLQKVRNGSRLAAAEEHNSVVVYDFDDHYLLEEAGTRNDLLRVFARADAVSAGSPALVEAAAEHHDRVWLFENPLDVARGARPRDRGAPWAGRLVWFGNRGGLPVLRGLDTPRPVTTVTAGGDVEWRLETVDGVLAGCDLALIPVAPGEWAAAKNANRLLKCAALGLPALVSRTPEHERTAALLGLPDWVLIGAGGSWEAAIARAAEEHGVLRDAFAAAREVALERYGIEAVAARWAEAVERSAATGPAPLAPGRARADIDVVVFSDAGSERDVAATVAGLRPAEAAYAGIRVVSALPLDEPLPAGVVVADRHPDFFDVYAALAGALAAGRAPRVVLVRAGVVPTRSFFAAGPELGEAGEPVRLFELPGEPEPPETLADLLARPYVPALLSVSRAALTAAGGLRAEHLALAPWELVIRLTGGAAPAVSRTPVAVASGRSLQRHPLEGYVEHVRRFAPDLVAELPNAQLEWERLRHVLHAAIVEEHRDLFASQLPAILPGLAAARPATAVPAPAVRPREDAVLTRRVYDLLETRGAPRALIRSVRAAWRVARPLVPDRVRLGAYRRHRALYELFFPERRPPRGR
ncbi:MAG: hypothetical protein QOE28_2950, partial [Solirubrobacteraceae bacterium]|nr:hypothetical protein [Solirubrobacteraceae bacterium]